MSNDIFILIPVHNRRETTLDGLRCLYEDSSLQHWCDLKIVVIDDGSTDGTTSAIQKEFPDTQILTGDGNLWWTGAMCKGMEYAYAQGGKAFFWLNDDCTPAPGSLVKMHELSVKQGNAVVGAACYISETNQLKPTGAKGRTRIAANPGEILSVDEMSGHCVYIPRAVIETIGLPDQQRFPHYHGDSSYILRATRSNFFAYLLGDAAVFHPGAIKAKLEDFTDFRTQSVFGSFQQVFLSQKSLYYLPTQFFYNVEKYGTFRGTVLFSLKLARWFIKWLWLILTMNK